MERSLKETRDFFKNNLFAVHSGISIDEVGDGYAHRVKDGRTTVFYEIKVFDASDRVVAFATMTGFRIGKKD